MKNTPQKKTNLSISKQSKGLIYQANSIQRGQKTNVPKNISPSKANLVSG